MCNEIGNCSEQVDDHKIMRFTLLAGNVLFSLHLNKQFCVATAAAEAELERMTQTGEPCPQRVGI